MMNDDYKTLEEFFNGLSDDIAHLADEEDNAMNAPYIGSSYGHGNDHSDSDHESLDGFATPTRSPGSPARSHEIPQPYPMIDTPFWDPQGRSTTGHNASLGYGDLHDYLELQEGYGSGWGSQQQTIPTTKTTAVNNGPDAAFSAENDTLSSSSSFIGANIKENQAAAESFYLECSSLLAKNKGVKKEKSASSSKKESISALLAKREVSQKPKFLNKTMERQIKKIASIGLTVTKQKQTPRGPKQKTPYTGVFFHARSKKFDSAAWNREMERQEYLGSFNNPKEAAVARDMFMIHLYYKTTTSKSLKSKKPEPKRKDIQKTLNQDLSKYSDVLRNKLANDTTPEVLQTVREKKSEWCHLVFDFEPCERIRNKMQEY